MNERQPKQALSEELQAKIASYDEFHAMAGDSLTPVEQAALVDVSVLAGDGTDDTTYAVYRATYTELVARTKDFYTHPVSGDFLEHTYKRHEQWHQAKVEQGISVPETMLARVNPFYTEFIMDAVGMDAAATEAELIDLLITNPRVVPFSDLLDVELNNEDKGISVIRQWFDSLMQDGLAPEQVVRMLSNEAHDLPAGMIRVGEALSVLFEFDVAAEQEISTLAANLARPNLSDDQRTEMVIRLAELTGGRRLLAALQKRLPTED